MGIYITENKLNNFITLHNFTQKYKSEIFNSSFSSNIGLFEDSNSIAGGALVSTAKLDLIINNTQFLSNSFTIIYEGSWYGGAAV